MKNIILATLAVALVSGAAYAAPREDKALPVPLPVPINLPFDPFHLNQSAGGSAQSLTVDQMVDKVRTAIADDASADLTVALKLATAAQPPLTKVVSCLTPIQAFLTWVQTLPTADQLPKIHLAVDVTIGTQLMIEFSPGSPILDGCSALAAYQKVTALNMATGLVTGAASLAALGVK